MTIRERLFVLLLVLCTVSSSQAADWTTPTEASGFRTTPNYADTMSYIRRLAAAAPRQIKLEAFGKSGEGRTLWTVIVSKDGVFDPAALHKANRPIVLIQNGIHAGEIDGKDASLLLLRDILITKTQANLIDRAVLIFIPVYNVDGHERISPYNRINQNGPEEMGWRTNATNLNLNRDYMKADAPETRALLGLWNRWLPDFFIDNHVTDGSDYQYDITYGVEDSQDVNPGLIQWVKESFYKPFETSVESTGHKIGPYISLADPLDPTKGIAISQSNPRYATGYMILQNRTAMLIEMHMLKDYKTRVMGNYETMRAVFEIINREADSLVRINREADAATIAAGKNGGDVILSMDPSGETVPFDLRMFRYQVRDSEVSGGRWIEYSKEPITLTVPRQSTFKITRSVRMPAAYVIPAQWTKLIDVLNVHGLVLQKTTGPASLDVEVYRCRQPVWSDTPYESRHTASFGGSKMRDVWVKPSTAGNDGCEVEKKSVTYPAGTIVVPMAQRAARFAVHFLEPEAPDSALAWGFLDSIFERKEYAEDYVLEKLALDMMAKDPKLKEEFERRLATDKEFASDSAARLEFFYKRSPYYDDHIGLYPVTRLLSLDGLPLSPYQ